MVMGVTPGEPVLEATKFMSLREFVHWHTLLLGEK